MVKRLLNWVNNRRLEDDMIKETNGKAQYLLDIDIGNGYVFCSNT